MSRERGKHRCREEKRSPFSTTQVEEEGGREEDDA